MDEGDSVYAVTVETGMSLAWLLTAETPVELAVTELTIEVGVAVPDAVGSSPEPSAPP